MDNFEYLSRLFEPYEPQLTIVELVEEVNRLYHSYEAGSYDARHPEIRRQLPEIWSSMIECAKQVRANDLWDVLDFGCGTGFASAQVAAVLEAGQLRSLTCYDPSPEMLEHCRKRLSPHFSDVRITSKINELTTVPHKFNVVLTNSVLHHLPDPLQTIKGLLPWLSQAAVWLCGHEPSARFYQNAACVELYRRYEEWHRWQRYFRPKSYLRQLGRALGLVIDPATQTAVATYRLGWFRRCPPRMLVSRLVDFHVAHSTHEVECGRGFDIRQLQIGLQNGWELAWSQSYNFLGPTWEGNASAPWRTRCEELRTRFPDDGANFCSIWRRVGDACRSAA